MPVIAVLAVIALWYVSTHGKGTAPGRLVAWSVAAVVVWVMVDLQNPRAGGMVASGFAAGIGQAVSGLGKFIGMLLT